MKQDVSSKPRTRRSKSLHFSGAFPSRLGGLCIAVLIGGSWLGHLCWLLSPAGAKVSGAIASPANLGIALGGVLLQTFLNTGLFITVHDAIHGLVCPGHPKINRALGTCFSSAYAGLSYGQLAHNHWRHHGAPMTASDPDTHAVECAEFWPWYFKFLAEYSGLHQFLKLASFLFVAMAMGHVSPLKLVIFWAIPLCLSSLQLFYFGTYQPHRVIDPSSRPGLCTQSQAQPWLISFLTCYHFSYHQEHHDNLSVPWWALPSLYRSLQVQDVTLTGKSITPRLGRLHQRLQDFPSSVF